jgi:hypothetical protein
MVCLVNFFTALYFLLLDQMKVAKKNQGKKSCPPHSAGASLPADARQAGRFFAGPTRLRN